MGKGVDITCPECGAMTQINEDDYDESIICQECNCEYSPSEIF